jgi:molybdopterin-guanine dinucleotide biosynthesis protein A
MATLGLILAGGRARRMGGADKALLPLGGRPLLAHAIERLRPQCFALALSANGDAGRFAGFELPVIADERPDFSGPLAGLLAGLEFSARHWPGIADVVTLPADTPFAPRDLVARLSEARREAGAEIAVARSGGREHHLAALWPTALAEALRRVLFDEGLRRAGAFAARYAVAHADWPIEPFDPFLNVNAPEELSQAERSLRL